MTTKLTASHCLLGHSHQWLYALKRLFTWLTPQAAAVSAIASAHIDMH